MHSPRAARHRRVLRGLALAVVTVAVSLVPAASRATTTAPVTVEQLAHLADEVVVAVPRAERSMWLGQIIVTDVELEVQHTTRGVLSVGQRAVLRLPGGVVGRTGQSVPGVPALAVGVPCVLFLRHAPDAPGTYYLAHLLAGALPLAAGSDGGVTVRPAAEGMVVAPGPSERSSARPVFTAMPRAGMRLEDFLRAMAAVR